MSENQFVVFFVLVVLPLSLLATVLIVRWLIVEKTKPKQKTEDVLDDFDVNRNSFAYRGEPFGGYDGEDFIPYRGPSFVSDRSHHIEELQPEERVRNYENEYYVQEFHRTRGVSVVEFENSSCNFAGPYKNGQHSLWAFTTKYEPYMACSKCGVRICASWPSIRKLFSGRMSYADFVAHNKTFYEIKKNLFLESRES